MGDVRNVYLEPETRAVLRTEDVYQTEVDNGVDGYSETLLSVVANFRNSGAPEGFNAQSMVGKSKRGEVALRLFAVVDPQTQCFVRAGFKARGCVAMTACASMICQMIEGLTFEQALAIAPGDVERELDGVPWDKIHTTYFAVEGVRALVGDYLIAAGASLAQLDEQLSCDGDSLACMMCEHCSLRDARTDLLVEEVRKQHELAERNALAAVFDDVREQSADGNLVQPARWEELGMVPEHLTPGEFEVLVREYWEKANVARGRDRACDDAAGADGDAATEAGEAVGEGDGALGEAGIDAASGLRLPDGYELVQLDGEWVLAPSGKPVQPQERPICCDDIAMLVGASSYYLYDGSAMTDAYAHWAFLAAEDDPVVTFADCVREESRIYPRPLAASNLGNAPFRMSSQQVDAAWRAASESGDYPDLCRTEATNGDVYYYSTRYLGSAHAEALAQWDAVERYFNV